MSVIIKRVDYLKSYSFVSKFTYVVIEISGHYLDGAADLKSMSQTYKFAKHLSLSLRVGRSEQTVQIQIRLLL